VNEEFDIEESLTANLVVNSRIYDALLVLIGQNSPVDREYLIKLHQGGELLGPAIRYVVEEPDDTEQQ